METETDLTQDPLYKARLRGEETINNALLWIERYYLSAGPGLVPRLMRAIRDLNAAMQKRDRLDIENALQNLLNIETVPLLGGSPNTQASTIAIPRVHEVWSESEYFAPETHSDRPIKQARGPVFISYSRLDAAWLNRLKIHLRPLERAGRIDLWHDGKIKTGQNWRREISEAVRIASSAILLLSANFMASDFIYENELQPIAKRAREEGVVVFPLIIGHCLFDDDESLSDFQLFNDPEFPLTRLDSADADKLLRNLSKAILSLGQVDHNV